MARKNVIVGKGFYLTYKVLMQFLHNTKHVVCGMPLLYILVDIFY